MQSTHLRKIPTSQERRDHMTHRIVRKTEIPATMVRTGGRPPLSSLSFSTLETWFFPVGADSCWSLESVCELHALDLLGSWIECTPTFEILLGSRSEDGFKGCLFLAWKGKPGEEEEVMWRMKDAWVATTLAPCTMHNAAIALPPDSQNLLL